MSLLKLMSLLYRARLYIFHSYTFNCCQLGYIFCISIFTVPRRVNDTWDFMLEAPPVLGHCRAIYAPIKPYEDFTGSSSLEVANMRLICGHDVQHVMSNCQR